MAQRSGLTRGDRRRNRRIQTLRAVVARDRAILAIDLGEDKQVAALLDHDGRVLGRRVVTVKAHALAGVLGWAGSQAVGHGFAGVVVGCEPTGHRWRSLMHLADTAGMGFVCVQPLRVHVAREADDYTRDKTDHKDAVLIGKLITQLECYLPERTEPDWARLRHLGQHRARLVTELVACGQQIRDLLSCCWPAALECAIRPLESSTWLGCLAVALARCQPDPGRLRRPQREEFLVAVRQELPGFGARRVCHRILDRFLAACTDQRGVLSQRPGALERVALLLADWRRAVAGLAEVEGRMVGMLDRWGLTDLVTSITGVSAVGAAVILAETGDLSRFATARSVVKHAGLNPAENTSASMRKATHVSHRGRPSLRAAAWRAAWGALPHNRVLRARFTHLTTRQHDRLSPAAARVACAATLLRWLHAVVTHRTRWDPAIAIAGTRAPACENTAA